MQMNNKLQFWQRSIVSLMFLGTSEAAHYTLPGHLGDGRKIK